MFNMKRILKAIIMGCWITFVFFAVAILVVAIIRLLQHYGSSAIMFCLEIFFVWIFATIYWYKKH